jgi:hypothetical protein
MKRLLKHHFVGNSNGLGPIIREKNIASVICIVIIGVMRRTTTFRIDAKPLRSRAHCLGQNLVLGWLPHSNG